MQHPILAVVEGGENAEDANPWVPVLEGFERALTVIDVGHPQHARVTRCYRHVCRLAQRPPLALAQAPRLGHQAQAS